jgi:hypothetical protein
VAIRYSDPTGIDSSGVTYYRCLAAGRARPAKHDAGVASLEARGGLDAAANSTIQCVGECGLRGDAPCPNGWPCLGGKCCPR